MNSEMYKDINPEMHFSTAIIDSEPNLIHFLFYRCLVCQISWFLTNISLEKVLSRSNQSNLCSIYTMCY